MTLAEHSTAAQEATAPALDIATQHHLDDLAWQRAMMASVPKFAIEAIRAIVLTSGGFALIGLAFVGSIYGSDPWQARALVTPIFLLAAGAFSGVLCAALSYIAQWSFARASVARHHGWEPPYVTTTPAATPYRRIGKTFQIAAVVAAVGAFAFMIAGGLDAWTVLLE